MKEENRSFNISWFFRWFLNNQAVTMLLVSLLVFLNVLVFTKISFVFEPVLAFITAVILPVVLSAILYYLVKPGVDWIEKQGLNRTGAIAIIFTGVALLLIWAVAAFIPMIQQQMMSFFRNFPIYVADLEGQLTRLFADDRLEGIRPQLVDLVDNYSQKAIDYAQTLSREAVNWAGNLASAIARVAVAVIISPFIIFYILRDGTEMRDSFVKYLPTKIRQPTSRVLRDINHQLASYVQGQVTVAAVVGLMFSILFSIIGLPFAITLGVMAGFLNMIPYLGSFLAMVPVVILAVVDGPMMLVKVAVVFTIEQTIEGRFVTPLVLGSKLNIHPITIMFILLTGGSMLGVWGVFLAIPVYASIKVVVKEVFSWYRVVSGLYEDETTIETSEEENAI